MFTTSWRFKVLTREQYDERRAIVYSPVYPEDNPSMFPVI